MRRASLQRRRPALVLVIGLAVLLVVGVTLWAIHTGKTPAARAYNGALSGDEVVTEINGPQIFGTVDEIITTAHAYIHVEMYQLQQQHISDELIAAKQRGVNVKVLVNQHSLDAATQAQ